MYLVYRLVLAAAFPFLIFYLLIRTWRSRRYLSSLPERLGRLPASVVGTADGSIWLHAVSVGEVLSSIRLIERLRAEYPSREIFVSSTTLAGKAVAQEKLGAVVDGIFYAPVDYCFAVRAVLRRLRPSLVVILETEIWPNLYREVKRSGAALVIVNARISDRALPRYRALQPILGGVLALPDAILAQSEVAARRYLELGAPPERVRVAGNLKYDFEPAKAVPPEAVASWIRRLRPEPVWIAASTMPPASAGDVDEDEAVLEAFSRLAPSYPRLLLILAPRRPERFSAAAAKLERRGISFLRRSELASEPELSLPGVLLLDSIGELNSLFRFGDVVFLGGTLASRGGHNLLEPAFFACPVVSGPHFENFPDIAEEFRRAGALVEIRTPEELAGAVTRLIGDPAECEKLGERSRQLAEARRGATDRALEEVRRLSEKAIPKRLPSPALSALLLPLAGLWGLGVRWLRARALARRVRLESPVISVGSLAVGGAGKTPFVLHLAQRLQTSGRRPAILTRGYRRRFPAHATILPAGAAASTALTGDEAQIFLRSGVAPVGIGADRYAVGRMIEERFHPDVILLDDGFQHWRLERSLDVVLVDAQDPFGGEALLPLGRLREPVRELARADLFVISRAEPGLPLAAIEARLQAANPRAPVFRCRVAPAGWVRLGTGALEPPERWRECGAGAFCGLANPSSFWRTLRGLGCRPLLRWEFPDHHHYRPRELRRVAAEARSRGAQVLLTTEKDAVNLPDDAAALVSPLELYWLRIGLEIEDEPRLLRCIHERLEAAARPAAPASTGERRNTSY